MSKRWFITLVCFWTLLIFSASVYAAEPVTIETFIDRYNVAINHLNTVTTDFDGYRKTNNFIYEDYIASATDTSFKSYKINGDYGGEITINKNNESIHDKNSKVERIGYTYYVDKIDAYVMFAEIAAIVYGLDTTLSSVDDAVLLSDDVHDLTSETTYTSNGIVYKSIPLDKYGIGIGEFSAEYSSSETEQNSYSENPESMEITPEFVLSVQNYLNSFGYDCGTADGIAGEKTRQAVAAYQADVGLPVTGEMDRVLMSCLVMGTPLKTFVDRFNTAITYMCMNYLDINPTKYYIPYDKIISGDLTYNDNNMITVNLNSNYRKIVGRASVMSPTSADSENIILLWYGLIYAMDTGLVTEDDIGYIVNILQESNTCSHDLNTFALFKVQDALCLAGENVDYESCLNKILPYVK